jgi:predicted Zn-dependent peptidase
LREAARWSMGVRVLRARLLDRLRNQQSLAYDVRSDFMRMDTTTVEVIAFADCLAPNSSQSATIITDVVGELASDGPESGELSAVLAQRRRSFEHPQAGVGWLDTVATDELEGFEHGTLAEFDTEAEAVTPNDVANALKEAFATSFLALPNGVPMSLTGFTPVPFSRGEPITGLQVTAMPDTGISDGGMSRPLYGRWMESAA